MGYERKGRNPGARATERSLHVKAVADQVQWLGIATCPDDAGFRAALATKLPAGSYASFYVDDLKAIVVMDKNHVVNLVSEVEKKMEAKMIKAEEKGIKALAKSLTHPPAKMSAVKIVEGSETSTIEEVKEL